MSVRPEGQKAWALIALVLALVAMLYVTGQRQEITWLESVLSDGLVPIQRGLARVGAWTASNWEAVVSWREMKNENARLKTQLELLIAENIRLREYRRENQWLREALAFQEKQEWELLPAQVVARDPGHWLNSFVIDVGENQGLRQGMAVVSPAGVVGQVRAVTKSTARIISIIDPTSAVGGLNQRTGDLVLVEGTPESNSLAQVKPLVRDADLQPGDIIVTSGLSTIFPKGLALGCVTQVEKGEYGQIQRAYLRSMADLSRLEYVFVVLTEEINDG
ncbi:MAG: rod shape-determining protein MreC [Limnochordia bacterium]|jgi:rod shape-determining protein MreC